MAQMRLICDTEAKALQLDYKVSLFLTMIGVRCTRPTLVVKTENCLYIPYIYILPHLCAMQYLHIACKPLLLKSQD